MRRVPCPALRDLRANAIPRLVSRVGPQFSSAQLRHRCTRAHSHSHTHTRRTYTTRALSVLFSLARAFPLARAFSLSRAHTLSLSESLSVCVALHNTHKHTHTHTHHCHHTPHKQPMCKSFLPLSLSALALSVSRRLPLPRTLPFLPHPPTTDHTWTQPDTHTARVARLATRGEMGNTAPGVCMSVCVYVWEARTRRGYVCMSVCMYGGEARTWRPPTRGDGPLGSAAARYAHAHTAVSARAAGCGSHGATDRRRGGAARRRAQTQRGTRSRDRRADAGAPARRQPVPARAASRGVLRARVPRRVRPRRLHRVRRRQAPPQGDDDGTHQ